MNSISLYVDNQSYLTKLHPFTKLLYIVAASAIAPLIGTLCAYGLCIGTSIVLLGSGKVLKKSLPLIAFSFTILITIFLIHGLFYKGNTNELFSLFSLKFYKEGVAYASAIGLNVLNLLLSFAVLVLTTRPVALVEELEKKGFSARFGYIITSVFQIIPQMTATMRTILDAQRSRGLETEGSLVKRAKAFLPLISPVVMSALINTRERAIALEVRGFDASNKKTYLTDRPKRKIDTICKWILLLGILLAVLWRGRLWLLY